MRSALRISDTFTLLSASALRMTTHLSDDPVNFLRSSSHCARRIGGATTSVAFRCWHAAAVPPPSIVGGLDAVDAASAAVAASLPAATSASAVTVLPPPITSANTPPPSGRDWRARACSEKPTWGSVSS